MGNPISPPENPYTYEDLLHDRDEKVIPLSPDCCFQWIRGSASSAKADERNGTTLDEAVKRARAAATIPRFSGNIVMHQPNMARRVSADRVQATRHGKFGKAPKPVNLPTVHVDLPRHVAK